MKMALSKTFWKYALLTMNSLISMEVIIFFTCGVIALGGAGSEVGAYIVTGIGSLVLTLSFWGCFAAFRESYKLSVSYLAVAMLALLSQTIFMIYYSIHKNDYIDMALERIDDLWEKRQMSGVQQHYSCCGRESQDDYDNETLPESCCYLNDCSNGNNTFTKGCAITLSNFVDEQSDYFIISIVVLTALELLGLVSAYYLCKLVRDVEDKVERIYINE